MNTIELSEVIFSIEVIGIMVTILSFIFAYWQYQQKRRVEKIISLEAVGLHNNIAHALGAIQSAKRAFAEEKSPKFDIGRTEGFCNAVLHESAKLYCNLSNASTADIDDLIKEGQLRENYRKIYYSYSNRRLGLIRTWLNKICKRFI